MLVREATLKPLYVKGAAIMKSTIKCKTLGELRMRNSLPLIVGLLVCVYSWFPAGSPRRVWVQ